jgi:peptidoglycan/LPS O-acetylase OafA/YrhL
MQTSNSTVFGSDATSAKPAGPVGGHEPALDGIRLFAFLAVFWFHAFVFPQVITLPLGKGGVTAFFVLSGFLIGGILLNARDTQGVSLGAKFRTFYARRSLRIFPVYYFVLAITTLLAAAGLHDLHYSFTDPWDWFYLINIADYLVKEWPNAQAHLWTLGVEEQFYLVAPLLILTLGNRKLSWICVLAWIGGAVLHYLAAAQPNPDQFAGVLPWMQLDPLTLGIAAAILQRQGRFLGVTPRAFGIAGIVCAILALPTNAFPWMVWVGGCDFHLGPAPTNKLIIFCQVVSQWFLSAAVAAVILAFWNGRGGWVRLFLGWKPIAYLGKISYGLYLYHLFVLVTCQNYVPWCQDHRLAGATVALAITIAISAISWHFIENPINELKRYFPYQKRETPAAPQGDVVQLKDDTKRNALLAVCLALLMIGITATVMPHLLQAIAQ